MGGFGEIRSLFLMMVMKQVTQQCDCHTANHHQDFPPVNIVIFVAFENDYGGDVKKDSAYQRQKIDFKIGVEVISSQQAKRRGDCKKCDDKPGRGSKSVLLN